MTDFPPMPLPPSGGGLGGRTPQAPPGSIFVLAAGGGFAAPPRQRFELLFGRDAHDVHVVLGAGDPHISRRHGRIVCHGKEWWLRNEGRLPIRLPRETFLLSGEEVPLDVGYSPLFIRSSERLEHLLEVRVVGAGGQNGDGEVTDDETRVPHTWDLSDVERLVLTALAQRYLRQERHPQPLTWKRAAEELNAVDGQEGWHPHRAANVIGRVRERLSKAGVDGLTLDEFGDSAGNTINHNLIRELLATTTLMPADLRLLDTTD